MAVPAKSLILFRTCAPHQQPVLLLAPLQKEIRGGKAGVQS